MVENENLTLTINSNISAKLLKNISKAKRFAKKVKFSVRIIGKINIFVNSPTTF